VADQNELHDRLERLEQRIADARKSLAKLDAEQQEGLGAWLEKISEELEEHDKPRP
jgi:hypothetical protein